MWGLPVFPKVKKLQAPYGARVQAAIGLAPWAAQVPPTERAGSEGSYKCCLRQRPPLVAGATTFLLKGSMSLDSQSPTAPYESSSFATPQAGAQQPVLKLEQLMICQARGALLSTVHILHRMCKSGEVRRLACP